MQTQTSGCNNQPGEGKKGDRRRSRREERGKSAVYGRAKSGLFTRNSDEKDEDCQGLTLSQLPFREKQGRQICIWKVRLVSATLLWSARMLSSGRWIMR